MGFCAGAESTAEAWARSQENRLSTLTEVTRDRQSPPGNTHFQTCLSGPPRHVDPENCFSFLKCSLLSPFKSSFSPRSPLISSSSFSDYFIGLFFFFLCSRPNVDVLQNSVLSPLIFPVYLLPQSSLTSFHGFHFYPHADDPRFVTSSQVSTLSSKHTPLTPHLT